jgi:hypothetical protein
MKAQLDEIERVGYSTLLDIVFYGLYILYRPWPSYPLAYCILIFQKKIITSQGRHLQVVLNPSHQASGMERILLDPLGNLR